jgi:hypothetical protein
MRQRHGFGLLLGQFTIGSHAFSVEWLIVMKEALHFIWIGHHLFVVASLANYDSMLHL